ncbi:MAG: hypothetical protein GF320_21665, partial [Armatimonadia bacterium]|nr:hypothetical protein [Armatimonadia bacterium]
MPRTGDEFLVAVLAGVVGLAMVDYVLQGAGVPDPQTWLTVALIPAALGWGWAGYQFGLHMRWAAL